MILRARQHEWTFPRPALVMGIVNVTPDSFSDGGKYFQLEAAVAHACELEAEGADLIDLGGESSRPNADPVSEEEELRRVMPVLEKLAGRIRTPISIDTQKVRVAREAVAAGACVVNDIAAAQADPAMAALAAETGAGYVLMHMQGTPRTMQVDPHYGEVVADVKAFFQAHLGRLAAAGLRSEQLVLDVGIGFGKRLEHNLSLIHSLSEFSEFNRPLLLGVSRKSFIGQLLGAATHQRGPAGLACACWAWHQGAQIIRTHEVAATVQALRMTEALQAAKPEPKT